MAPTMALTMIHLSSSPRLAGLAKGLSLPAELAASGEVIVEVLAAELGATCDRANFVARGSSRGETAGGFRRGLEWLLMDDTLWLCQNSY